MSREQIHNSFVRRFSAPRMNAVAPVTTDDLQRVEQELAVTFPAAYIAFLTRHGPVFTPSVLDLVTGGDSKQPPEGASFDVQEFFEPKQIIETHQLYTSGGMEDWLVPVAMDCMGNVFGFKREECHRRPEDCSVFFFDHDFCKIHQVADSFDAWLASYLKLAT
jgi:SMI1 / KNR4 family (SUKH-1)